MANTLINRVTFATHHDTSETLLHTGILAHHILEGASLANLLEDFTHLGAIFHRAKAGSKHIAIELVLTDDKMLVNADMSKIQQVLYNLLDNAIKFSHHDSSIKIETPEKHSKVFVSVKDSGIGIPKEDQKLIFDRFYKSDASRGKDKKGTGLGLSIVKEIIKAHEENINVISTQGVGTEFIFSLPKAAAMDAEDE